MVDEQENGPAVHAAGERDANRVCLRATRIDGLQPLGDFVGHRTDVQTADLVEVRWKRSRQRREVPCVDGIGIGAPDERQVDDVVSRHHARIAWMKLGVQAVCDEGLMQRIDAVRHIEGWTLLALRQEVAHRSIHRSREPDGLALDGHERERSVDAADGLRIASEDPPPRFLDVHVDDSVQGRVDEIDDTADRGRHREIVGYLAGAINRFDVRIGSRSD